MAKTINLGWGNSVCVRKAFLENCWGHLTVFSNHNLANFDYPAHEGDNELIEITKTVIKRQTGQDYKYVLLTNGATGGVVISLRFYKMYANKQFCRTRKAPHYVRYPSMIAASGLIHDAHYEGENAAILLDMPSNPLGIMTQFDNRKAHILDGVYLNRVYTNGIFNVPDHDLMVGSYSKLLGLNGIRVGWIATNDHFKYERIRELVTSEYCGLGMATSMILKNLLDPACIDWNVFEREAKGRLDYNREQWSKLEKFFGDTSVLPIGMFYYAPIDSKCKELLQKSDISYVEGSAMGTTNDFGRFNLGQDNDLIKEAVKRIIQTDKIR